MGFFDRIGAKLRKTAFGSLQGEHSKSISELPNVMTSNPAMPSSLSPVL
jgi:hypothetical protein